MQTNRFKISDELVDRYLDGDVTPEELAQVLEAIQHDEELKEFIVTMQRMDEALGVQEDEVETLPMAERAGISEGNLCDVLCEEYILKRKGINIDPNLLSEAARDNKWLYDQGTPLHSMGRLLEKEKLQVERKYKATLEDIVNAIATGHDVMVVVNYNKLTTVTEAYKEPNHAIVVIDYLPKERKLRIHDPASNDDCDIVDESVFMNAWGDSTNYLVTVKMPDGSYNPQPIVVDDIELDEDLLELREAIAENAHDVWARQRMNEGWTYGSQRDDEKMHHPDLIPYAQLTEGEKEYDRQMAFNTIKLVIKLGYDLIKNDHTELHQQLIRRMRGNKSDQHYCPQCNQPIFKSQVFCEHCGRPITWKDLI